MGVPAVTVSGDTFRVQINQAAADGSLVDYLTQNLTVTTGPDSSLTLAMDGQAGELIQASGNVELGVGEFFHTSGGIAFQKQNASGLKRSDGSTLDGDLLSIGGAGLDAFTGLNGGTDDALGLQLQDVEFGLALITDAANPAREYTSLQASAGNVSFTGIDGLTLSASELGVAVNLEDGPGDAVVDYGAVPLTLTIAPGRELTLDMAGTDGELYRATGEVNVNVFDFFNVQGQFGLEKKTATDIALSDGSTADMELMTIGATGVNAFVGLNGGSENAAGMSLGSVDFALALMADVDDPDRQFASLQATAGSAVFTGIDTLTVEADQLAVAINQGIELPAVEPVTTTANTVYQLDIYENTVGTVTFSRGGQNRVISLNQSDTNSQIIAKITAALEGFSGIGAGKVQVSGDRYEGYQIEFIGALAGQNVAGFGATTTAAAVSVDVQETDSAAAGISEVKLITVETPRVQPTTVSTSVTTVSEASTVTNEVKALVFTTPYSSTGTYDLTIGGVSTTVTFRGSMTLTNQTKIAEGLATILGTSPSDIGVTFASKWKDGHRYNITFRGTLAGLNIGAMTVTSHLSTGNVLAVNATDGAGLSGEVQNVNITTEATGVFTLSLDYQGSTHSTDALSFDVGSAAVETALNGALSAITGARATVGGSAGNWLVTFGGDTGWSRRLTAEDQRHSG